MQQFYIIFLVPLPNISLTIVRNYAILTSDDKKNIKSMEEKGYEGQTDERKIYNNR